MTRQVRPHPYAAEPGFPPDHRGRSRCTTCGVLGVQGDARHPDQTPVPPARPISPVLAEAASARDAAILGEHDE